MIQLTRLNKKPIGVNSDLVKFVESSPDTVITLINGEKILVRESYQEIVARIVAFRRRLLGGIDVADFAVGSPGQEAVRRAGEALPAVEDEASAEDSDAGSGEDGERA